MFDSNIPQRIPGTCIVCRSVLDVTALHLIGVYVLDYGRHPTEKDVLETVELIDLVGIV